MFADKRLAMRCVTERFRSTSARDRESTHNVCELQTLFHLGSAYELMDEACVKAVAGTNGIGDIDDGREARVFLLGGSR